jgi:hyaluronan synthase
VIPSICISTRSTKSQSLEESNYLLGGILRPLIFQHRQPRQIQRQQRREHREIDKKRWFVRYLILAATGSVLSLKLYMALFVMDFGVGIYSVTTSFILFNILLIAYTKYKDPLYDFEEDMVSNDTSSSNNPLVSIIVPVKNEEGNIRNCVQSCINSSYSNKEIIVVNDGSTDMTPKILDEMRRGGSNLYILHLSKSVGKKKAIEAASEIAKGEIYASMDSDCDMDIDAVKNAVKIFVSDRKIGALTGHGRVRGADTGNILQKMQDVYIDGSCRALKGMESSFSSVTCCSGSLSFFRREAIQSHLHSWAHDRFIGIQDFKFATDRRLTAYVLAAHPPPSTDTSISSNLDNTLCLKEDNNDDNNIIPILQTGKDNLETMKSSSDPDIDAKADHPRYYWKVKYSQSVKVNVGVPDTFTALMRQQIRWRKSFIRSLFTTAAIYWRRPPHVALLYYLQLGLKFLRPYIVLKTLIFLPLSGDFITTILYFLGVFFTGMLYGVDFRLRNPGNGLWLYRPVFTFLTTFVYTWLILYAGVTIKKAAWR